ncbi:MAG: hypothetical protein PUF51_07770 [Bifidobacteriaceae bacterium]|nr:hypothetical protein [Bifidobacteriaceae bacterium]
MVTFLHSAISFPHRFSRLAACALAGLFVTGAAACGGPSAAPSDSVNATGTPSASAVSDGRVAMFLPSDGFTLSQSTPQNTWKQLASDTKSQLESVGFDDSAITVRTAGNAADQAQQVADYLDSLDAGSSDASDSSGTSNSPEASPQDAAASASGSESKSTDASAPAASSASTATADSSGSGNATEPVSTADVSRTVIIVALAGTQTKDSSLYSDYVVPDDTVASASPSAPPSPSSSSSASSSSTDSTDSPSSTDSTESSTVSSTADSQAGETALAEELNEAQEAGATVINVGDSLSGFTPNVQGELSSARLIGRLQALGIVSKLHLASSVENAAQSVEVLVPYADATFAKEAFEGIWEILGPYYTSRRIYSPSGKLGPTSTADSWQAVAYTASSADDTKKELQTRLDASARQDVSHMKVDAVLCLNDQAASGAVSALKAMGYTGTSATINPDVSISGLVDNLRGGKDLSKQQVPHPAASSSPSASASDSASGSDGSSNGFSSDSADTAALAAAQNVLRDTSDSAAWPLVTGYGTYKSQLTSIVSGEQWFTGLEDRQGYAQDLARIAQSIAQGGSLEALATTLTSLSAASGSATGSTSGSASDSGSDSGSSTASASSETSDPPTSAAQTYTLQRTLLAITADNLKSSLIDKGYVSAADAGL